MPIKYGETSEVYTTVVTKACNARYGEVLKNYAEEESLRGKGKLAFRSNLLSMAKKADVKPKDKTEETVTSSRPLFVPLVPGQTNVMGSSFLKGKVFVLTGLFDEVDGDWRRAYEILTNMIEKFGGGVKMRFSSNTTHLLVGKNTSEMLKL